MTRHYRLNKNRDKTNGFTIIEVVLVLAIAGLIFLVVFLALPALQKSQRDNARKQDVAKAIAGLQQYMSDHDNSMPTSYWYPAQGYFDGLAQVTTVLVAGPSSCSRDLGSDAIKTVAVLQGCKCDGLGQSNSSTAIRYGYARIKLESGGYFCREFGWSN